MESGPPLTQSPTFKGTGGFRNEVDLAATLRRNGTSTEGLNLTPILISDEPSLPASVGGYLSNFFLELHDDIEHHPPQPLLRQ
jgi:hypothetical protein